MSGGGGDQDITTRTEPWDEAKPYFVDLYGFADTAFAATSRTPFPGPFLAGENSYDLTARTAVDTAITSIGGDISKLRSYVDDVLDGHYLDPSINTWLAGAVDAGLSRVQDRLQNIVLPSLVDQAIQAGAYSGTAHGVLEAQALADFTRESTETSAKIYFENYVRERAIQAASPEAFTIVQGMEQTRVQLNVANADMVRALEQIDLDELWRAHQESIEAPWRGIAEFGAVLNGSAFANRSEPPPRHNRLGSALQGGMGGAIAGAKLGSMVPGIGNVAGAIGGGLLGALGGGFGG